MALTLGVPGDATPRTRRQSVHLDNFNVAVDATAQDSVTRMDIVRTFGRFAATYPHDGVPTADALLTVARYTHDAATIRAVGVARLPRNVAGQSGGATAGRPLCKLRGMGDYLLPPSPLGFGPAPGVHVCPGSGTGNRPGNSAGWTAVWVAPHGVPAGWGVEVQAVADDGPGGSPCSGPWFPPPGSPCCPGRATAQWPWPKCRRGSPTSRSRRHGPWGKGEGKGVAARPHPFARAATWPRGHLAGLRT